MNAEQLSWIQLTQIPFVGPVAQHKLIRVFKDPRFIFEASKEQLNKAGLSARQVESILHNTTFEQAHIIAKRCSALDIEVLTPCATRYPFVHTISDELPNILYVKGQRCVFPGVGIVGARRCTQEDKARAAWLAQYFVTKNKTIISGMAKGVDSYAHTAAIQTAGKTIAVLGCGIDICYPSEHQLLMQRIQENGLLVSEYPPGTAARSYNFPQRNRIIAALSETLYVVGAGKKSGARITAQYAEKYNKEVIYDEG